MTKPSSGFVQSWQGDPLLPRAVRVTVCWEDLETGPGVALNLCAEDGSIFAHAHMDIRTAEHIVQGISDAIKEAKTGN